MSVIDAVKGLNLSGTETSKPKKSAALSQDDFLKLITTQMTHQDPTKPMDNSEFVSQMAQIGAASGIQELQQSFKDFATSISSDQALQAASLVGRTVSVPSDEALLSAGKPVKGTASLPASSPSVKLTIIDPATGNVVATQNLGEQAAGTVNFEWDGNNSAGNPASPGIYKIQVEALVDGANTALQPTVQARVDSVSMANDKHDLQVNLTGLGPVNFNKITQILNQES